VQPVPAGSAFAGFRFPPDVIVLAVRWYLRFGLSYRDVEELLAERGIDVDHVTVHGRGCGMTAGMTELVWPGRGVLSVPSVVVSVLVDRPAFARFARDA
jgi:hypothetical protein